MKRPVPGKLLTVVEAQEFLCLAGFTVKIDGNWGPKSKFAMSCYKRVHLGINGVSGDIDETASKYLANKMTLANTIPASLKPVASKLPVGEIVASIAEIYVGLGAREVGGNNYGPWVRYFSGGAQGKSVEWCSHFATGTVLDQAEEVADEVSYPRGHFNTPWTPTIEKRARAAKRLISSEEVNDKTKAIRRGMLFLVRGAERVNHVGIVVGVAADGKLFETIEGNTSIQEARMGEVDLVARRFRSTVEGKFYFVDLDRRVA